MFTSLDLANHFGFKVVNGNLTSLKREITVAELDRPGLELLGLFQFHEKDRIMLIGNKEMALIKDSDPDFIYHNCIQIANPECPAIIITHDNPVPECLLKAAKENNCPLFVSNADTSDLMSDMYIYLSEALAKKTALHACLLEIYGTGVLLLGESGIGKSEISLELIKKGHQLIADDRVNIASVRGKLIGTCPESIYGMMEVRGIGIIDVARMFGINSLSKREHIKLVIDLISFNRDQPMERIGMKTDRYEILGESVPLIKLPVSAARSMAEIIEAAVTNFKLKDFGYDTGYEFQRRLSEIQEKHAFEKRQAESIIPQNPYDGTEKKTIVSMNPEPDVPIKPDSQGVHVKSIPVGLDDGIKNKKSGR
ncbi:MAG: HPr(Ser) kinase/phosphatase [Bacilli bacterium]